MNLYERHILPHVIDCACGTEAFRQQRAITVPQASGIVLDLGVGTGRNLEHYDTARVRNILGINPCRKSLAIAARRAEQLGLPFTPIIAGGEQLPLESASVDCIVLTFTLCTIPDADAALSEMRRVMKTNSMLLFCEHSVAEQGGLAWVQRATNPVWRRLFGGCQLTRNPIHLMETNGFHIVQKNARRVKGAPAPVSNHVHGTARLVL